jgi:hypothetical protein
MGMDAAWLLADAPGVVSALMEQQVTRKLPPPSGHISDTMGSYPLSWSMLMPWLILGITCLSAVPTSLQ